jgi:hypothetical protein
MSINWMTLRWCQGLGLFRLEVHCLWYQMIQILRGCASPLEAKDPSWTVACRWWRRGRQSVGDDVNKGIDICRDTKFEKPIFRTAGDATFALMNSRARCWEGSGHLLYSFQDIGSTICCMKFWSIRFQEAASERDEDAITMGHRMLITSTNCPLGARSETGSLSTCMSNWSSRMCQTESQNARNPFDSSSSTWFTV